jgi:hypothetical protein
VVRDAVHDRFRIGDRHVRLHFRVLRFEFPQDLRQDVFRDRRARAEHERPGDRAGQVRDARVHLLGEREDTLGIVHHEASGGCQRDAAVVALE